ncbi:MAG: hypothetical protein JST78_09415 [Bacteroidetes bacterium]|nr:hypothetical protein [Bacteroidota bacterium]
MHKTIKIIIGIFILILSIGCGSKKKNVANHKSKADLIKENQDLQTQRDQALASVQQCNDAFVQAINAEHDRYERLDAEKANWEVKYQEVLNQIEPASGVSPDYSSDLDSPKVIYKTKTVTKTVVENQSQINYPKNIIGNIAFFCDREMREETTSEVRAMLSPLFNDQEIKNELLKSINESRAENNQKPLQLSDLISKKVNLGYYLKVELLDPGKKFQILNNSRENDSIEKKIFDDITNDYSRETFEWNWSVTPKAHAHGQAQLLLMVTPLDKNHQPNKKQIRKAYAINVKLKQAFWARVWDEMNRNPQWAVGSIIAPIVTFLAGRYLKKSSGPA